MAWANPNAPNLPDFVLFVRDSMGIGVLLLPDNSPYFGYAFNQAMGLVLSIPTVGGIDYTLAVYNCGGHILIRITPDQTGRDFFIQARETYALLKPVSGVVNSSSDNGTSFSSSVSDALEQLTISDLQFFKTPWGREYLAFAQDFGGIWGLS